MEERLNFLKLEFEKFFIENHPDHVCSFKSKDEYHLWLKEFSDNALDYYENLIDSNHNHMIAEEITKEEFLRDYKFSPFHHFLSIFEENFPEVFEGINETQYNTFTFLSFYFLCQRAFDKYPKGQYFVYSDELDNDILNILSSRLEKLNLINIE